MMFENDKPAHAVMLLATRPASMTHCFPNGRIGASNYRCVHGTSLYFTPKCFTPNCLCYAGVARLPLPEAPA